MALTVSETLHSGRVLLMDGAMGSELIRLGRPAGACRECADVDYQLQARRILDEYVAAGAECLLTNTFQTNPVTLAPFGLASATQAICQQACRMARQAAAARHSGECFVIGDIGPVETIDRYLLRPIVQVMDVDAFLLETLSDTRMLGPLRAELQANQLMLASFTFLKNQSGELITFSGMSPEQVALAASSHDLAALGVNCGRDISVDDCIEIVRSYRTVTDLPLFARPNAGTPTLVEGRWVYPHTPEQMASRLPALLEAGVTMVGGCCGTTPAHIAAFRQVVDRWNSYRGVTSSP
jgi:5-methyltetrahydrofolate--homocysteine methyltransferase